MIVALLLLFASVWIGLALANELVAPISRLITAADRVRTGDLLARVPEEGPDSDEFVHAQPSLQPDDDAARQPAARADRGQPAARRAAPLHRDGAGRRQCRGDRHRRRAPDRAAQPGGPGLPRRARQRPGRPAHRRGAAGLGQAASMRPTLHPERAGRAAAHAVARAAPAHTAGPGVAAARRRSHLWATS